jgi:hypothetical protein
MSYVYDLLELPRRTCTAYLALDSVLSEDRYAETMV